MAWASFLVETAPKGPNCPYLPIAWGGIRDSPDSKCGRGDPSKPIDSEKNVTGVWMSQTGQHCARPETQASSELSDLSSFGGAPHRRRSFLTRARAIVIG